MKWKWNRWKLSLCFKSMMTEKKYKILIWLVVILFVMNLATIFSVIYHSVRVKKDSVEMREYSQSGTGDVNGSDQGARYFRDLLELSPDQMIHFRESSRNYNRNSHRIARELEMLRLEMVTLMTEVEPDTLLIDSISREVGEKHRELKKLTSAYYFQMRNFCTPYQKEKLDELFLRMAGQEEPEHSGKGRRQGRGWRSPQRGR